MKLGPKIGCVSINVTHWRLPFFAFSIMKMIELLICILVWCISILYKISFSDLFLYFISLFDTVGGTFYLISIYNCQAQYKFQLQLDWVSSLSLFPLARKVSKVIMYLLVWCYNAMEYSNQTKPGKTKPNLINQLLKQVNKLNNQLIQPLNQLNQPLSHLNQLYQPIN